MQHFPSDSDEQNVMLSDLWLGQGLYHLRQCKAFLCKSLESADKVGADEIGNDLQAIVILESRLATLKRYNKTKVQKDCVQ